MASEPRSTDLLPVPVSDADAALPWDLRIAAERLALVADTAVWDLPQVAGQPLQGEALRAWVGGRNDRVSQHLVEMGIGLWLAKREQGQAAYLGMLQDLGIPQQRASEAVILARLIFGAPAAAVPVLATMPARKLLALAPGGSQLLAALVQDGTLGEVPGMDRDSIRALVRERMETARLRATMTEVVGQRDEALDAVRRHAGLSHASRRLAALRLAALEEVERLRADGLALQRVLHELRSIPQGLDDTGYDEACHALVYGLQGLQALVDRGIFDGLALREHYTPGERLPPAIVTPEEEARVRDWAAQFLAEADLRHAARAAGSVEVDPVPTPRGRTAKGMGRGR